MATVGSALAGYTAGLFPSADIIANGLDPRRAGSGNPGAANIANLLGKKAGAAVFGLDMGKAVIATQIGRTLSGAPGANIAGSAAVLGHCFPVHKSFRGGKGVAASFGQMLGTFPAYLPVDIALGAVAAKSDFWKKRPVATIGMTCGLWTSLAVLWAKRDLPNFWDSETGRSLPLGAAVSSVAIVYRFAVEAKHGPPEAGGEQPAE